MTLYKILITLNNKSFKHYISCSYEAIQHILLMLYDYITRSNEAILQVIKTLYKTLLSCHITYF